MKKTGIMFAFITIFIMGGLPLLSGSEEQTEKIAIASDGETIDSQVGYQGARSPWFLFFDQEGQLLEALENPHRYTRGNAGIKCAELLAEHEITVFVAGNVGEKMASALESNNITFIAFTGSVEDAIKHVLEENHTQEIFTDLEKIPHPQLQPESVWFLSEFFPAPARQDGGL